MQKDRTQERKEKRLFWKHHIAEFKKSGLTQKAYCAANNLKLKQLQYWKKKLTAQSSVTLVQIPVETIANAPVRIVTENRYEVIVSSGFAQHTLRRTLEVLKAL